jgi:outer membrane immunogenic protein
MHKLRTQLFSTTAILVLSSAAYAADMPVKAPPAPPAPPVTNWTGFYVGGQLGGAGFDPSCNTVAAHPSALTSYPSSIPCGPNVGSLGGPHQSSSSSASSFAGGGKIGYDYQWGGFVWGLVGDFNWVNLK